jgi:hypothetical protein
LWLFISIWGCSHKTICKIKGLPNNYLWGGNQSSAKDEGISLITIKVKGKVVSKTNNINLGETLHDLLDKWALKAYELGDSNIQTLLSYKLAKM